MASSNPSSSTDSSSSSSSGQGSSLLSRTNAIKVFACLATAYLFSYGLRSINAAIAPELVADFSLSNADLGSLSSAYFLSFALMQIPLGVWLDRYGTRRTTSYLVLVAAAGCLLFSLATTPWVLWLARAMIGAGFASCLMGALRAFRFWFAADRQQQLVAWMLTAGTLGALLASAPSRELLPLLGWQGLFQLAAGMLVVSSAAIWWFLPRNERVQARVTTSEASVPGSGPPVVEQGLAGYLLVYRDRYFWRFVVLGVVLQSSFVAFQSLWIGPWFTQVMGQSAQTSGQIIFAFNLVLLFAFLALGGIARQVNQRGVSMLKICQVVTIIIVLLHGWLSVTTSVVFAIGIWFAYAIASTPYTLVQAHVGMSFPPALTGRAYTAFNLLIFTGMFLVQWLFGVLVDWCMTIRGTEDGAFRLAMQVWVGAEIGALLWLSLFRATPFNERHRENKTTA